MGTPPTKALATGREKRAEPARTIATELPHELSRLSVPGFTDVTPFPQATKAAPQGGGRTTAGRPTALTTAGFTRDDGHPTILAAARDANPRPS